jgi:hypothetical protein
MTRLRPCAWQSLWLALLAVVLVGAACAAPTPTAAPVPTPGSAVTTVATKAPAQGPVAPTKVGAQPAVKTTNLPMGVDANGNFYRGDPKATVKLIEYSDFQ